MFDTLVESRPTAPGNRPRYTILSVFAHAGLIAGAAAATASTSDPSPAPIRPVTAITFVRDLPGQAPTVPVGGSGRRQGPPVPPHGPVLDIPIAIPSVEAYLPEPGLHAGSAHGEQEGIAHQRQEHDKNNNKQQRAASCATPGGA